MTQNAISYLMHLEGQRHNKETEREATRSNLAREMETMRSNMARETETQRADIARELIDQRKNDINYQHYTSMDAETFRHNLALESEQHRSNVMRERIEGVNAITSALGATNSAIGNLISQQNANTNRYNAETNRLKSDRDYQLGLSTLSINQQDADTRYQAMINQANRWNVQNVNDMRSTSSSISRNEQEIAYSKSKQLNERVNTWINVLQAPFNTYSQFINSQSRMVGGILRR